MTVYFRSDDLDKLGRELRAMGSTRSRTGLRARVVRNMVAAARPIASDARARVRATPARSGRHTGLRDRVAGSIQVRPLRRQGSEFGVRVIADPTQMPGGERNLPALLEGLGRWRHPVFGNSDVWVTQRPHRYMRPAGRRGTPGVGGSVELAARQVTAHLNAKFR